MLVCPSNADGSPDQQLRCGLGPGDLDHWSYRNMRKFQSLCVRCISLLSPLVKTICALNCRHNSKTGQSMLETRAVRLHS